MANLAVVAPLSVAGLLVGADGTPSDGAVAAICSRAGGEGGRADAAAPVFSAPPAPAPTGDVAESEATALGWSDVVGRTGIDTDPESDCGDGGSIPSRTGSGSGAIERASWSSSGRLTSASGGEPTTAG